MHEKSSESKFLLQSAKVFGFIVFFVLIFIVSFKFFENRATEDYSNSKPEIFPIVVVTKDKSELVFTNELPSYTQNYSNYTFLIADENLTNRQLEEAQKTRRGKGTPQVKVTPVSGERQLIEIEIGGDGLFNAKYEATDKEYKPLTMTVSGPLFSFLPCTTTLIFGFLGIVILNLLTRYLRKKRQYI